MPLGDGAVVTAHYQYRGDDKRWMPDNTGDIVAALDARGAVRWIVSAPARSENMHCAAVTPDGSVWALGLTHGPFEPPRKGRPTDPKERPHLARVAADAHVDRDIDLTSVGVEAEAYPVYLAPAQDNSVVAVVGSKTALFVVRIGPDGTKRFVRRLERGGEMPLAPSLRVVGTYDNDRIWLAGAGTSLTVETGEPLAIDPKAFSTSDGMYHGPIALSIAIENGDTRAIPLETQFVQGVEWKYPNGIALVGNRIVLSRSLGRGSLITLHEPTGLAQERELFRADEVVITKIVAEGTDNIIATAQQRNHAKVRYGDRLITTSTAPPTVSAAVAFRLPVSRAADPRVITAATSRSADTTDDVGGNVTVATPVVTPSGISVLGTFEGLLRVDDAATLHGVYGTEDRCTHEDYRHRDDCDRIFWEDTSAFVIFRPTK